MSMRAKQFSRPDWIALVIAGALSLTAALAPVATNAQQSPFTAAITVNDRAVTYYEIEQRRRFLELLNAPGDLEETAREDLVNERLQAQASERLGLTASAEEIEEGMAEFTARANLEPEQFIQAIAAEGVSAETFRDFVAAGVTWRNVLRTRFGPRAQVTEEEIDRALTLSGSSQGARILLAELVIPLTPQNQEEARAQIQRLSETLDGDVAGFSAAARRFSAAGTARAGGSLGWRPLSSLPPGLRSLVLTLGPGDVTEPIPFGPAIAIFQLRDFEETDFVTPVITAVEYATIPIEGGRSEDALAEAQRLRNDVDVCDDLYGARPGGFTRQSLPIGDVPADVSLELAKLDDNEMSFGITRNNGQILQVLMLCGRSTELPEGGREEVRQALFQQRLESYADGFLAELRADAIITEDE
ncbi:peptidylprolyl isomerase [Rhodophyticola sp.]|jgi:peptidyl-prolyl cis-trans isomerase SurA|uniref:peptidylprolyl isomerase n=1 Tax=Rhodophyticola sp. TaxID=2680032 RepID=UPI003D285FB6